MSDTDRASPRRGRRIVLVLIAALIAAFVVLTPLLFVLPATDGPTAIRAGGPVDAVVVLGGSPEDRLAAATDLVATLPDPPPTLVLSVPYEAPLLDCGSEPTVPRAPVTCFAPEPATTSGEAVWIATEAAVNGWERVAVVTSDYHVTRTRILVEECRGTLAPDTDVLYIASDTDALSLRGAWRVATEWPSLLAVSADHVEACRD